MWITSSLQTAQTPTHIALGNFDGVHLGHQRVMAEVVSEDSSVAPRHRDRPNVQSDEQSNGQPSEQPGEQLDSYATVVTFSPHPQAYFSGISRPLLTPVEEKAHQLASVGIEQLVTLPFDSAIASLSPKEFVERVLVKGLRAQKISVGSDFRFGKGRSGDAQGLREIAARFGVPVVLVPLMIEKGDRISSSRIREALQTGDLTAATQLLGRPYTLSGAVVEGKQIGRTIGFPTANLQVPSEKFLPRTGVYSVRAWVGELGQMNRIPVSAVMNVGNRPTVSGQDLSVEVHLIDWTGDLYGRRVTVSLDAFIRPEQKFGSLNELKAQIVKDCEMAKESLSDQVSAENIHAVDKGELDVTVP